MSPCQTLRVRRGGEYSEGDWEEVPVPEEEKHLEITIDRREKVDQRVRRSLAVHVDRGIPVRSAAACTATAPICTGVRVGGGRRGEGGYRGSSGLGTLPALNGLFVRTVFDRSST